MSLIVGCREFDLDHDQRLDARGRALVDEALRRGAERVYAAMRSPVTFRDTRVTPLTLDVTSVAEIRQAATAVGALDILVNSY